jgi:hypothetical protein
MCGKMITLLRLITGKMTEDDLLDLFKTIRIALLMVVRWIEHRYPSLKSSR